MRDSIAYAMAQDGDKCIISDGETTFITWLRDEQRSVTEVLDRPSQKVGFFGQQSEKTVAFSDGIVHIFDSSSKDHTTIEAKECYISPVGSFEHIAIRIKAGVKFIHHDDESKNYLIPLNAHSDPIISAGMSLVGIVENASSKILTIYPFDNRNDSVTADIGKRSVIWGCKIDDRDNSVNIFVSSTNARNTITQLSNIGGELHKKAIVTTQSPPVQLVSSPSGTPIAAVCSDGAVIDIAKNDNSTLVCSKLHAGCADMKLYNGSVILATRQTPTSFGPIIGMYPQENTMGAVKLREFNNPNSSLHYSPRSLVTSDRNKLHYVVNYARNHKHCVIVPVDDYSIKAYHPISTLFAHHGFATVLVAVNRQRGRMGYDLWSDNTAQDMEDVARILKRTGQFSTMHLVAESDYADAAIIAATLRKPALQSVVLVDPALSLGGVKEALAKVSKKITLCAAFPDNGLERHTDYSELDGSFLYDNDESLFAYIIANLNQVINDKDPKKKKGV